MNPYPGGQCTWGAAEMCQCLQNTAQYGNFGNGGDWYAHAQSIGLQTSKTAQIGWLVSLSTLGWPDGPGDVGLVIGMSPNGDIIRYGVNWHRDGKWSTDTIPASMVIGSFKPPCVCMGPANQLFSANSSSPQGTAPCMTFRWQWSILGQNIDLCFDPIVGMVSVVGGIAIMAVGVFVLMIATGNRIKLEKAERQEGQPQQQQQQTQPVTQQQQSLPSGLTQQQHNEIVERARERARQRKLMQPRTAAPGGSSTATAVSRVPVE